MQNKEVDTLKELLNELNINEGNDITRSTYLILDTILDDLREIDSEVTEGDKLIIGASIRDIHSISIHEQEKLKSLVEVSLLKIDIASITKLQTQLTTLSKGYKEISRDFFNLKKDLSEQIIQELWEKQKEYIKKQLKKKIKIVMDDDDDIMTNDNIEYIKQEFNEIRNVQHVILSKLDLLFFDNEKRDDK